MQLITSNENSSVKLYRKLAADKKSRTENKLISLEGLRLIEDAARENAELHYVFVSESFIKKHGDALDFLPKDMTEKIILITDILSDKMALTDKPQGIFAICKMPPQKSAADIVKSKGRYIFLHNIQDPGNIGTIIRTADAVGISGVIAVSCCDIFNPKVIRSTMGSVFRMSIADTSAQEAFEALEANGVKTYAAVVGGDAVSLTDCTFADGSAVLIGNEGNGLPEEISQKCDVRLTIKMNGNINSLNAATAASIIMWELSK